MKRWWWIAAIVVATSAGAQQAPKLVVTMESTERDTFSCRWERMMTAGTATVTVMGIPAQADASPGGLVAVAASASGNLVSVTLYPDGGCGVASCRNGNNYQVKLKGTDSDGNTPTCNFQVKVRDVVLQ